MNAIVKGSDRRAQPGLESADWQDEGNGGNHPPLQSTADWIILCQSCASDPGPLEAEPRPALTLRTIIGRLGFGTRH